MITNFRFYPLETVVEVDAEDDSSGKICRIQDVATIHDFMTNDPRVQLHQALYLSRLEQMIAEFLIWRNSYDSNGVGLISREK